MQVQTTDDVLDLLDGSIISAAVGAAMELGLFWLLAERPMSAPEAGEALGIPGNRCGYLLQVLERVGLVAGGPEGYRPSEAARRAILEPFSQESWAFLAGEARDRMPVLVNLATNIRRPESAWELEGLKRPDYLEMLREYGGGRRFTRMLY